ncbi:MAG: histidine kinase [Pseudonocardiales bacterium]
MADLGAPFGRHGVSVIAACFAVGALVEHIASPTVTLNGRTYDRGSDAVVAAILCAAVVLVALRGVLGVWAPISAGALIGIASLPAPVWVLESAFVFLLVMLTCGISGYLAVSRIERAGLLVLLASGSLAAWRHPEGGWGRWGSVIAFMSVAWVVGALIRGPVVRARSAEERAILLEEEQAAAAWQALAAERRRIARELHDIIAHSVSVMTVQAGAVRRLLAPSQTRERDSLLSVERTGREAMTEMRRLVGLLKEDDAMPSYAPQPGMQTLDALIVTMRAAGLPVELDVQGERRELPPGVDLAAFRVVQEALTNALKHAGPARARVQIHWTDDGLWIEVADDGSTSSAGSGNGYGQAGMRERLRVYGGHLDSGPRADGGYTVRAYLPIGTAS